MAKTAKLYPSDYKTYTTWYKKLCYITQDRIENAVKRDSSSCMVSEAIKAQFPVYHVITDSATIRMTHKVSGMRYVFLTPPKIQVYIADWDEGRKIEPFEFRLGSPIQITKHRPRVASDNKPLDVTTASSREVKDAIRKGSNITGKTVINHSPKQQDRAPIVIGGDTPPLRTVFGHMRRYGYRGLARHYEDVEAKARQEGIAIGIAQAKAQRRRKRK